MNYKTIFLLILFFSLFCLDSVNGELQPETGTQGDDIPLVNEEQEQAIDDSHQRASEMVLFAAGWIDSFFDDGRSILEENTTRAKLRLSFGYTRFDQFEFSPKVSLRLKLPKLSNKALLIISTSDDDEFDADDNPIMDRPSTTDDENSDLTASIRYFLKVGENYNLSTTAGVSFNYLYAGLRYRYEHEFGPWLGRFLDIIKWYTDDGWENKLTLDLDRYFSKNWFFRTSYTLDWYEKEKGLPQSLTFLFYQVLCEHRALRYEIGNFFDTEPNYHMTDIQFRVRFRQRFFRDWLIFEVAPQVGFPKDHDRDPNPGIILRVEGDFGYLADHSVFQSVFGF